MVIVSTSATARQFENESSRDEPAEMRKQLQDFKEMLASGKTPSGAPLTDWRRAMLEEAARELELMQPDIAPASYLTLVADTLESISAQVRTAAKEGLSLEQARKKLDVERFRKEFAHGDEQKARAFDGFLLGPGVPRAFREAKEGPLRDES